MVLDGKVVGAVVFSPGARNAHRLLQAGRQGDVLTLARLWLSDDLPSNSESRVIAISLRLLRREGQWKAVVTYADPSVGHTGTIYRAAGFLYLGVASPEHLILLADGRAHHPRSLFTRYGSNDIGHLRRTGIAASRVLGSPKHRYLVFLDPSWGWRLTIEPVTYPKERPRGPPPD